MTPSSSQQQQQLSSIASPPPPPTCSKQKAGMLLKMANAVEDSSARRHQKLHGISVNAGTVNELLYDLTHDNNGKSNGPRTNTSSSPSHAQQQQQHQSSSSSAAASLLVQPQQVHLLYSAMIRYRENAELRYQLLELRHLDLSRSFVELEGRYRHLEAAQEAWKQSCEALQQAAADTEMSSSTRSAASSSRRRGTAATTTTMTTASGAPTQRHVKPNLSFNSTVPILQQELKSLTSQRNQLLQANLELRKQLKQMQIQMQTPKAGEDVMMATCRRCHPELLAGRQPMATDTLAGLVEHFQSTSSHHTTSTLLESTSHHRRNNNNPEQPEQGGEEDEFEEEKQLDFEEQLLLQDFSSNGNNYNGIIMEHEEDDDEANFEAMGDDSGASSDLMMDSTIRREEHKHQDKMNLLGLQLSNRKLVAPRDRDASDPSGLWGSQHQPVKQKSIVWSPSSNSSSNGHQQEQSSSMTSHNRRKNNHKPQMVPTMNSILPMHQKQKQQQPNQQNNKGLSQKQKQQQQQQDILVSPRKETSRRVNPRNKEISLQPANSNKNDTSGMDRFGILDEFGRSTSYRVTGQHKGGGTNSADSSSHSGTTIPIANTTVSKSAKANANGNGNNNTKANKPTNGNNNHNNTQNKGGGMSLFRRKSAAVVPSQQPQPTSSQQQQSQQRRTTQRHSLMGPPVSPPGASNTMSQSTTTTTKTSPSGATMSRPAPANARHLEYHLPGNQTTTTGPRPQPPPPPPSSLIMNIRHLEFAAHDNDDPPPPSRPPPLASNVRAPAKTPAERQPQGAPGTTQQQPGRRAAPTPHKRPTSHDVKGAAAATRNHHSTSAAGSANRNNGVARAPAPAGGRPNLVGPTSARPGPILPNNRDQHHQTVANRANMPSQHHTAQHTQHSAARAKNTSNEERKRPQSYFERIKKTLQQEI